MIIIELTYTKPLNEVEKHLEAHRDFLAKFYDQNVFIASGPKEPRNGGVILAQTTKAEAEKIIAEDPFKINRIADYRIIAFTPNKYSQSFSPLLNNA